MYPRSMCSLSTNPVGLPGLYRCAASRVVVLQAWLTPLVFVSISIFIYAYHLGISQFKYGCSTSHSGHRLLAIYQITHTNILFIQSTQLQYTVKPHKPHTQNTTQHIQFEHPHYFTHTYAYFDHDGY